LKGLRDEVIRADPELKTKQELLSKAKADFESLSLQAFGKYISCMPAHYVKHSHYARSSSLEFRVVMWRIVADIEAFAKYHESSVSQYAEFVDLLREECLGLDASLSSRPNGRC